MKVLIFRYDPCGWEHHIEYLPGQTKAELVRHFSGPVKRRHRRTCEDCKEARRKP